MRNSARFLIRAFLGLAVILPFFQTAGAAELILSRVLEIDREKGTMVVIDDTRGPDGEKIQVDFAPQVLTQIVEAGDLVRIWGSRAPENGNHFTATHIRIQTGSADPTGVRSRLRRGYAGHGRGSMGGGGRKGKP